MLSDKLERRILFSNGFCFLFFFSELRVNTIR
ncbi:Uncharacterised protein [Vibrio cholerae]|nr:Uncharacterised protein [Vibrio cholerae]